MVVIDDEPMFAGLLKIALSGEPDLDCLEVAHDVRSGIELVDELWPDLVLLDAHLHCREGDGVAAAARIVRSRPSSRVVLLIEHTEPDLLRRAADAGVCSVLPKDRPWPELVATLRSAGPDRLAVHPSVLRSIVEETPKVPAKLPGLSRRERDVLTMMMTGLDARATAERLGISVNTCRGYVKAVLRKLNAHSSLEAVAIARKHGLVEPERIG